jgi:hypothetical protein
MKMVGHDYEIMKEKFVLGTVMIDDLSKQFRGTMRLQQIALACNR